MIRPTYRQPAVDQLQRWWSGITIASLLEDATDKYADSVAVVDGETVMTFGEVARRATNLAAWLGGIGVEPGDVVAVQLPNWWETVVVYWAVARLGAICNPLVPLLRRRELAFMFSQSSPKVAVIPASFRSTDYEDLYRELSSQLACPPDVLVARSSRQREEPFHSLEPVMESTPDTTVALSPRSSSQDVALLMYTSGTTSEPKGVLHHHDAIVYEVRSIVELLDLGPDDSTFMVSPLSHISGFLFAFVLGAMTGAPAVLQAIWEPAQAVDLIERHECRFTMAAPVFLHGILEEYRRRGQRSSLSYFLCGGADVPSELVREARSVLGTDVMRTYGLTEMPTLTAGRPGCSDANISTDGFLIGPALCRLERGSDRDSIHGELLVRGPELFCGYLDPSHNLALTDDGFFRTGDVAVTAPDGTVTIFGRVKDIVNRGGEKISSREVEEALLGSPEIAEIAVVGEPDERLGERVLAFVVPQRDSSPSVATCSAFLDGLGMARQKHPERVVIVSELPRTASGKVQKQLLNTVAGVATGLPGDAGNR